MRQNRRFCQESATPKPMRMFEKISIESLSFVSGRASGGATPSEAEEALREADAQQELEDDIQPGRVRHPDHHGYPPALALHDPQEDRSQQGGGDQKSQRL